MRRACAVLALVVEARYGRDGIWYFKRWYLVFYCLQGYLAHMKTPPPLGPP